MIARISGLPLGFNRLRAISGRFVCASEILPALGPKQFLEKPHRCAARILGQGLELLGQFSELDGPQGRDVCGKCVEVVATIFVNDGYELQCCIPNILCLETKELMGRFEDQSEIRVLGLQVSLDQCLDQNTQAKVDYLGILALEPFDQLWSYILSSVKSCEQNLLRDVFQIGFVVLDFVENVRRASV